MASTKYRTPDELNNRDFNYYIAFGIDPNETNVKNIEAALIQKRNTFAGTITPINQRLMELKDDIDKIMLEDAISDGSGNYAGKGGRKQESDRAKEFYKKEAIELVKTVCENGTIFDTYISNIAKDYYITDQEIIGAIKPLLDGGVKLIKTKESKRAVSCRDLEKVENLLPKDKKDVYDFLGLTEGAASQELLAKSQNAYNLYSKKQNDPKSKAGMDLTGIINKIFKSDQGRKEYDIYNKTRLDVWSKLNKLKKGGLKEISGKVFVQYVSVISAKAFISKDDAEKELYDYLAYFTIAISNSEKLKFEKCPHCGESYVYKEGIKNCPACGKSLELKCWNCGNVDTYTSEAKPCSKCGIAAKSKAELDKSQNALNLLLKNSMSTDMQLVNALNTMENVYPEYEKYPNSVVYRAIAEAKRNIEEHKIQKAKRDALNEKYVKDIERLLVQKRFCEAEGKVKSLMIEDPQYDVKEYNKKIFDAKEKARQYVDKANVYVKSNDEAKAIELCSYALDACADYEAAKQLIKNYPPKKPTVLNAVENNNTVKLNWQVVGDQKAITYTLIRKIGAVPNNITDGDVLASGLTSNYYEDASVVSGVAYYYAVFSSRGGVNSGITWTSDAIMLFLDVTNVHQEKVDGAIKVTYQLPDNVSAVEVYKKDGAVPPLNRNDGQRISGVQNTGFTDSVLKESKNSYLIICKYKYSGKEYYSKGIKVSYAALKFPKKLTNTSVTQTRGNLTDYEFTCDEPINGSVKLYFSKSHVDYQYGEPNERADFLKRCRTLKEVDATIVSNTKMNFTAPDDSILWLYPVCYNDQLFVINEPILINTVIGIENINVISKNGSIDIEGTINPDVRNIIAVISPSNYVDSPNAPGEQRKCSRDTFIQEKCFHISLSSGMYYITLFTELNKAGSVIYSRATKLPEVIDNREKINVDYTLDYTISAKSSFTVTAQFKAQEALTLPKIDLVAGYPAPLRKSNGVVIGTLNGGEMKKKMFKEGYYYTEKITVGSRNSLKDHIVLFFNSNDEKHLKLRPQRKK